jgi:delta24-sterol reductase
MLAFNREQHVVMVGTMTDSVVWSKYNPIGRWYKPWFYTHVQQMLKTGACDEYLPLRDYYHRHTRSLFWEVADIIPFGNHWLFRLLLGWTMPPKPSLLKLTQTEALRKLYEQHHAVQDMLVPMKDLSEALDVFDRELSIYPLWLCPFKLVPPSGEFKGFVRGTAADDMYVDIGAYGNPTVPGFVAKDTIRRVEEYVRSVSGYQMMYADSYMTREEFRAMFDHAEYDELRKELPFCEEAFPEVYDKVSKAARH